jgi:hypothetical protein
LDIATRPSGTFDVEGIGGLVEQVVVDRVPGVGHLGLTGDDVPSSVARKPENPSCESPTGCGTPS